MPQGFRSMLCKDVQTMQCLLKDTTRVVASADWCNKLVIWSVECVPMFLIIVSTRQSGFSC